MTKLLIRGSLFLFACGILSFFMLGWFMPFNKFKLTFKTSADSARVVSFLLNPANHDSWLRDVHDVVSASPDSFKILLGNSPQSREVNVRRIVGVDSSLQYAVSDRWLTGTIEFKVRQGLDSTAVTFYHDTWGRGFLKQCLLAWRLIWTIEEWQTDLHRLKRILDRPPE